MDLILNDQQILMRDAAAKLGAAKGGARRARKLRDAGSELDAEAWTDVVAAGWLSALVAEGHDGLGLGAFDLALALEETGKTVLMTPLVEAASSAWALSKAGRPLSDGRLVVPAVTVAAQGYGLASPLPCFDVKSKTLTGAVTIVAFADTADDFLVEAQSDDGPVLCLIPRSTNGVVVSKRHNVDGSDGGTVGFKTAAVTEVVCRGNQAAGIATGLKELLVLGTCAELLGVAEAAFAMTLDYIKFREQFGKAVGSFQALQHRAANTYVDAELNHSMLYAVLSAWDAGTAHPAMIAAAKARISRGALATVRTALQLHGAIGYTDEHDIGIYYKRAVALAAKYGNEFTQTARFSELTLAAG